MSNSPYYVCRKMPCVHKNYSTKCELNKLIKKFHLRHECPCYSCIVKTICKELCNEYTRYIDPILFKEYGDHLFDFPQDMKYNPNGSVSRDFLEVLIERVSHYREHKTAYVELDTIEFDNNHIEYATAKIIQSD